MSQTHRAAGGLIDRSRMLRFTFDGRSYEGHPGDTLASALIANGVRLMGRSFKYHRPRGVLGAGSEEPNALVELGAGARRTPNTRATTTELYDGLVAASQNRWPSLRFDLAAATDWLAPLIGAGFYYKTFMWPAAFWERVYEPLIRRAAGLGRLSMAADPDAYDKGFLHADVLVIGAGPAGLMAALAAGRAGARVILADEDFRMGGRLLAESHDLGGRSGAAWVREMLAELASMAKVRLMPRTTVHGAFDHGIYGALERVGDHLADSPPNLPRQTHWRIYAKRAVLCAGAIERPIAFGDNDRPGILLAGAARAYANRFGALVGRRLALFTNHDDGLRTATDLRRAGAEVVAIVDVRAEASGIEGIRTIAGGRIVGTSGRHGVRSVTLAGGESLEIDALAVSGGWNPTLHLTCHQRGRPVWRDEIAAFVPGDLPAGLQVAGAAAGTFSTAGCLREGAALGAAAAEASGHAAKLPALPEAEDGPVRITAFWYVKESTSRAWLDQQNDVTLKDVRLSHQEGYRSVEHLKRYTTLGMATDQGKTANVLGLAILAELGGTSIPATGTTIFRPPYTPVTIGALAGRSRGQAFRPSRLTPSHGFAEERGAPFVENGLWLRAQWFPQPGEHHWRQSVDREVLAVRRSVSVCDVSTLGKIDVQGTDAGPFLNHIYANGFARLPVGKCRYGLMLREDGIVMDDGTVARLAEHHFILTTTTAHAVPVLRHLEFARQCLWPDLDVQLIPVTEQWAQFAIAGPDSRRLLREIVDPGCDISNDAFPYLACGAITICGGLRARLFRLSFSGELAYELAAPARHGDALMRALLATGEPLGAVPYGLEALTVLRIEKGHPAGPELDGCTTARDLGLGRMVAKGKDAIGRILSERLGLNAEDGVTLMGFKPIDARDELTAGALFLSKGAASEAGQDQGWMTSVAHSPNLGHAIGLGFIQRGHERIGETVRAVDLVRGRDVEVEICSPHFIDPAGERLRA